jgi:cytochrome c-type biogenesis protein CcmH
MTLWLILAVMTAAALGAVIWPLARARVLQPGASDLAVYRDQLEEIERDRVDGRIGHDEFEAARVEVSRRLLAAATAAGQATAEVGTGGRRVTALVVTAIAIPLLAAPLYALLGSPDLPGEPAAGRVAAAKQQTNSIGVMIARIEAHLEEEPEDGRGWEVLAPVYMRLERYDEAVKARRNALKLLGDTATREVDLGEALTAQAGGSVTPEAKAVFDHAIEIDANDFKAMFYLGLAAEQSGQAADAARIWRGLIAKAPANAPWLEVVRQALSRVEGQEGSQVAGQPAGQVAGPIAGPAAPGPRPADVAAAGEMTPDQRNQMIRGMVERLATKLHEDGSDVEGWLRLLRAYMVLGDRDKAKAAAGEARSALAGEPEKLRLLDQGIKDLGVEG